MQDILARLQAESTIKDSGNLSIITKSIPYDDIKNGLDPLVKKLITEQMNESQPMEENQDFDIQKIRESMGFDNLDLAPDVKVDEKIVPLKDRNIPIRIYNDDGQTVKPAIVFFHGGGFIGGSLKTVENPCKYLAYRADCIVISVDYRLAPEHPFPAGLMDCYEVVKWAYDHATDLSIDANFIGVAGDSAGANLANACSLLDAKENNIIKYQSLIYPTVNLSSETDGLYEWNFDHYEMSRDAEMIQSILSQFAKMIDLVPTLYIPENESAKNPLISPIFSREMNVLPATSVIVAEFDNLKVEGKVYAEKLAENGVPTKLIEYKGMDHAFIDKLGVYPQAEDCLIEIAKDFKNHRSS